MTPEDQVWRHVYRNLGVEQQPTQDNGTSVVALALCAFLVAVVAVVGAIVGVIIG